MISAPGVDPSISSIVRSMASSVDAITTGARSRSTRWACRWSISDMRSAAPTHVVAKACSSPATASQTGIASALLTRPIATAWLPGKSSARTRTRYAAETSSSKTSRASASICRPSRIEAWRGSRASFTAVNRPSISAIWSRSRCRAARHASASATPSDGPTPKRRRSRVMATRDSVASRFASAYDSRPCERV